MAQHQPDRILLVEEDMHLVGIISEADIRSDEGPMTDNYRWVLPSKGSSRSLCLLLRLPQRYLHDLPVRRTVGPGSKRRYVPWSTLALS